MFLVICHHNEIILSLIHISNISFSDSFHCQLRTIHLVRPSLLQQFTGLAPSILAHILQFIFPYSDHTISKHKPCVSLLFKFPSTAFYCTYKYDIQGPNIALITFLTPTITLLFTHYALAIVAFLHCLTCIPSPNRISLMLVYLGPFPCP